MIGAASPAEFAAAVEAYIFEEVALDPLDGEVVLVGEAHGVRQTPNALYALACALGTTVLGLEWSHDDLDDLLQPFVHGGDLEYEALWGLPPDAELFSGDGRFTAGHFALLHRLRDEGRLEQLILFDRRDPEPNPEDWRPRDRDMAVRLLTEWRRAPLLAAAGAFHVDTAVEGTMAWHVAQVRPDLRTWILPYERLGAEPAVVPQRPRP